MSKSIEASEIYEVLPGKPFVRKVDGRIRRFGRGYGEVTVRGDDPVLRKDRLHFIQHPYTTAELVAAEAELDASRPPLPAGEAPPRFFAESSRPKFALRSRGLRTG